MMGLLIEIHPVQPRRDFPLLTRFVLKHCHRIAHFIEIPQRLIECCRLVKTLFQPNAHLQPCQPADDGAQVLMIDFNAEIVIPLCQSIAVVAPIVDERAQLGPESELARPSPDRTFELGIFNLIIPGNFNLILTPKARHRQAERNTGKNSILP
ncbi:hypothetical protein [Aggregatilinea lenta]|uniref:hypothetical protein n=1 Tax=Aggregatilinea lenta TaxID=913108 RepID=UPI0013C33509|nr:hypothetical protein [Aggregatilinea lenta]